MAIFASRRVNVDPFPWRTPSGPRGGKKLPGYDLTFDPRPEFDNVVNPVLVEFRDEFEYLGPAVIRVWLDALDKPWAYPAFGENLAEPWALQHIDHARRVLQKLANLA